MEAKLARIPFSRQEEQTISSMAGWMRFMAVIGIIVGLLMLLLLVIAIGCVGVAQQAEGGSFAKIQSWLKEFGPLVYSMLAILLLAALVAIWQGFTLYSAGDSFGAVARTDEADQDYVAKGLDQLRVWFKVQVMIVVITAAVAVGMGLLQVALMAP